MELSRLSTKELVEELTKREGVAEYVVEPYVNCKIKINDMNVIMCKGPARVLHVFD